MMDEEDPDDIEFEQMRRAPGRPPPRLSASKAAKPARPMAPGHFYRVPRAWLECAMTAPGKAVIVVALYVYRHWCMRGHDETEIEIGNRELARLGVLPNAKWKALRTLECLGLIRTRRVARQSVWVAVLDRSPPEA